MNYIEQIKGFWLAQEVNQLGTCEISVYFYLLEVWNKTGWAGTFYRNNYKVMADLSIRSPKTLQAVRDRLKGAGLLVFKTKNGDANVMYQMLDLGVNLGKKYRGSVEGSYRGSGVGSVEGSYRGSGIDNINQTKLNNIISRSGASEQKKIKKYWAEFIKVWDDDYRSHFENEEYQYLKKDFNHLGKIHEFFEKRARARNMEFSEQYLCEAFKFFLNKAWKKDEWLRKNYTPSNMLNQFNAIVNETEKSAAGSAKRSGESRLSAIEKLVNGS